jgi:Leucine-rich repeat (LRR) protein
MKKLVIIFGSVLAGILAVFFVAVFVLSNDESTIHSEDARILINLIDELGLIENQVQSIPKNYAVIGNKYGLYYKTDKQRINEIWLYNLPINDIPADLTNFKHLKSITIDGSIISRINEVPESIYGLEELNLRNNYINRIENLEYMVNLKRLDLSYNRINKIEGLGNLSTLEYLNLEGNEIEVIENLELFINKFELYGTKLMIGQSEQSLTNIKEINLKKNPFPCIISNIAEIHKLEGRRVKVLSDCD